MIYCAAIEYLDLSDDTVKWLYVASVGFTTKPTDTPAHVTVEGRVQQPALKRRDIFDFGTTGGASRVGYGYLVLNDEDHRLDVFETAAIDGRTLIVYYADTASVAFPAGWTELFRCTMEQTERSLSSLKIRMRDSGVVAQASVQPTRYAGDNVGPVGVEGNADLTGKVKPYALGGGFNAKPIPVNPYTLIFQIRDGAVKDLPAVYDSGALLGRLVGSNYADQADMEANEPGEGEWRLWKEGGMFRLGSAPVGELTNDFLTGDAPSDRTAAALYRTALVDAGIDPAAISSVDLTALDAANRATLGLYYPDDTSLKTVLDDIARSVGAWWGTDNADVWRIQRLEAPSGSPVVSFTRDTIRALDRQPLNSGSLPVWRVTVRGVPNYTVQKTGLVGQVGAPRRARLAIPYQDAVAVDTAVKTAHPLATELVVETKLACLGACQTEATRLLALYSVQRSRYEVVVTADAATLAAIDLGVVVSITYPALGLDSGLLCRVLGYQLDPTQSSASLTLWG